MVERVTEARIEVGAKAIFAGEIEAHFVDAQWAHEEEDIRQHYRDMASACLSAAPPANDEGWRQGYEAGQRDMREQAASLGDSLMRMVETNDSLDQAARNRHGAYDNMTANIRALPLTPAPPASEGA